MITFYLLLGLSFFIGATITAYIVGEPSPRRNPKVFIYNK